MHGETSDDLVARDHFSKQSHHDPADKSMKITAIKAQVKRAGRYSIFVNDKYAFSLSEGALLDQKIIIGQTVTVEGLAAFKDTAAFDKAYGNTLAYVARRLRSEWELHDYFRRKEIAPEAGDQILERLRNYGYVSDLRFAQSWLDNRRAIKPVSRRRIQMELRQKHVPDEYIRQVLEADDTSDLDTLRQLVYKKRQQTRYQDPDRLMRYLAGQGYGYDDIKQALAGNEED